MQSRYAGCWTIEYLHFTNAFRASYAALLENGYCPLPVGFNKRPALYRGMWHPDEIAVAREEGWPSYVDGRFFVRPYDPRWKPLESWQSIDATSYEEGGILYADLEVAKRAPVQGVGVHHVGGLLGIDVDSDDPAFLEAVECGLAGLVGVRVRRKGSKGFLQYVRCPEDMGRSKLTVGAHVIDLLAGAGSQSVLPPTWHPSGKQYVWVSPDTLLDTPREKLPFVDAEWLEQFARNLADAMGVEPATIERRTPGNVEDRGSFTVAALENLDSWIHDLGLYGLKPKRGGGYCAVAHWRGSGTGRPLSKRKRNLHIDNVGIVDFGDNNRAYSPVRLVAAALRLSEAEAFRWLDDRLGLSDARHAAIRAELAAMPAVRMRINGGRTWLVIDAGGENPRLVEEPANDDAFDAAEANAAALAAAKEVRERLSDQAALAIAGDRSAAIERHRAKVDAAKQAVEDFKNDPRIELAEQELADSRAALAAAEASFDQLIRTDDDHAAAAARDHVRALKAEVGETYKELHRLRKVRRIQIRDAQRIINAPAPKCPVPVQQINVYPGLGKTTAAREELFPLLAMARVSFVYAAPSHHLAKETLTGFQAVAGADAGTWWPGQTAVQDGEPICKRHREAEAARKAGLSAGGLCGVDAVDEDQRCPFWQSCPVWNARSGVEGRSYFTATSMLFQPRPDHIRPRAIVIDESITPLALGADAIEIELERFLTVPDLPPPKGEAARQAWERLLADGEMVLRAIRERAGVRLNAVGVLMSDGSREAAMLADIGPRSAEALARLAGYVSSTLRRAALTAKSNLADIESLGRQRAVSIRTAEAWAALADECLRREYNAETGRIRFIERGGKVFVRILPLSRIHSSWLEPEAGVERIILLNGTPERTEWLREVFSYHKRGRIERPNFLPAIEITRPPLAKTVRVEQWRGVPFASSKLGMTNRKRANVDLGAHNRLTLSAIVSEAVAEAGADKSVIIAPEKHRSAIFAGAGANMLERGKSAGTNDYERAGLVVYIDAHQPPEAIREKAMRLAGRWLMPDQWTMSADREYLPDDDTAADYLRWERRSAALQAAERCRTRWVKVGEDGKPIRQRVIIMSDASDIFPADEVTVRQWGSVSAGGLKAEARDYAAIQKLRTEVADLMANGGIVTTHPGLMEAIHGRKFDDRHLSRLMAIAVEASFIPDESAQSAIYNREGDPMHFMRIHRPIKFRELPANKRRWTVAFVRDEAIKAMISKHFRGNVEFQGGSCG
ncbi:bifunctional DNA primase/polymerase [Rhizobium oryzicola]|uniref:Bifunctional DNA primase/polymerase n=1 Tax=Rhizobium oryzicola TaxID=1232668 RepID=A0ABT8SS68_9HYPH|nr:bifunctional DNA primase/polymerase [Rhizobium oryzicola]MDO1580909.1 bifunctional DNA primase/polymerase [Rhizobium oryzicola]